MKQQHEPIPPKVLQALNHVAIIFEIPVDKFLSKLREKEVVTARHTAIGYLWSLKLNGKKRFTQGTVGSWFGLDHTSVIHACANVKKWKDVYPEYRENYKRLENSCEHIFKIELTLAERIDRLPKYERDGIIAYITKLETNSPKTK